MSVIRRERQRVSAEDYNRVFDSEDPEPRWPDPEDVSKEPGDWYEVEGQNLHVIPVFVGERKHQVSRKCWCKPRRDRVEKRIVIHNRRAEA